MPSLGDDGDPVVAFQRVVDRYRRLMTYRDTVRLIQITQRDGEEARRIETQLACDITDGQLHVESIHQKLRRTLGIDLPLQTTPSMQATQQHLDLWLAPHMAMRFTDTPLKQFRAGIDEGFTPIEVESVIIDNKTLVHIELKSGDGQSESCNARFDLFVNPDSMLIERIDGEQRLPDGASFQTTLHITPVSSSESAATKHPTDAPAATINDESAESAAATSSAPSSPAAAADPTAPTPAAATPLNANPAAGPTGGTG
jgi:hypothetical protein